MSTLTLYIIQICSGSVSLISTSFILVCLLSSDDRLGSPYRRIIFAISVSDIFQSLSFIIGPFAVPSWTTKNALWSIGNDLSCQVDGFLNGFAANSTPMYMLGLCVYTYLKIKCHMTDNMYSHRIEKLMHLLIISWSFGIVIFAVTKDSIHSTYFGSFCQFAYFPTGCRLSPDIECDTRISRYVTILNYITTVGVPFLCLLGIICCMGAICSHIHHRSKLLASHRGNHEDSATRRPRGLTARGILPNGYLSSTNSQRRSDISDKSCLDVNMIDSRKSYGDSIRLVEESPGTIDIIHQQSDETIDLHSLEEERRRYETSQRQEDPGMIIRLYRKEIFLQACCFVLAFFITFIFWWITIFRILVQKKMPSSILRIIGRALYPLGGFFNMLAYSRPKVKSLRIKQPEYSLLQAFWCIIKEGGDVPSRDRRDRNMIDAVRNDNVLGSVQFGVAKPQEVIAKSNLQDSDLCVYDGSQSFGPENIEYRSKMKWSYNIGSDSPELDCIKKSQEGTM